MRSSIITIHEMKIPRLDDGSTNYWPIRRISEEIGISWHSQAAKLQPPRYRPTELGIHQPGAANIEMQLCLPQSEFEFWLKTLNPRKISPTARLRLAQLRQHFLGEASPEPQLPEPTGHRGIAAPLVLGRMVQWKLQQVVPSARPDALKDIADLFRECNGFEIIRTGEHQLRSAVTSLSAILSQLENPSQPRFLSVSQRVDAIIQSLVEARGRQGPVDDAELAALMCGVELERLQKKSVGYQPH